VKLKDISLAGRILANFPEKLTPAQRINDELTELGELATRSGGQHHQAAQYLRLDPAAQGRDQGAARQGLTTFPDYPDNPATEAEKEIKSRYGKVFGQRRQSGIARRQFRPPRPPAP